MVWGEGRGEDWGRRLGLTKTSGSSKPLENKKKLLMKKSFVEMLLSTRIFYFMNVSCFETLF